jgi:hypothetical protein
MEFADDATNFAKQVPATQTAQNPLPTTPPIAFAAQTPSPTNGSVAATAAPVAAAVVPEPSITLGTLLILVVVMVIGCVIGFFASKLFFSRKNRAEFVDDADAVPRGGTRQRAEPPPNIRSGGVKSVFEAERKMNTAAMAFAHPGGGQEFARSQIKGTRGRGALALDSNTPWSGSDNPTGPEESPEK